MKPPPNKKRDEYLKSIGAPPIGPPIPEVLYSDLSHTLWIAVVASVCGGLAAKSGAEVDPSDIACIAAKAADDAVILYQTRANAGAL